VPGPRPDYEAGRPVWQPARLTPGQESEAPTYLDTSLDEMTRTEVTRPEEGAPGGLAFTLEEAINHALGHNRTLRNSYDGVSRTHYNLTIARSEFEIKLVPSAGYRHGVDGGEWDYGGSVRKLFGPGTRVEVEGVQSGTTGDEWETETGVEITQPLLRGGGRTVTQNGVIDARRGIETRRRSYELAKERLVLDVASAYYEIMRQRAIVALNERSEERVERLLETSRAKQDVGLASQLDILRAEIQLAEAQDTLASAKRDLEEAGDDLKRLLGLNPEAKVDVVGRIGWRVTPVGEEEAVATALRERLDLREQRSEIADGERELRVARNEVLPDLDLAVGYSWSGTGSSAGTSTGLDDHTWSLSLTTSTDIRKTAERARLEQRRIDIRTARRSYADLEDRTIQEVRREVRNLGKSLARITIQEKNLAHARRQLQLARLQFVKGLADNFDVIDAEQNVIRVESRYIAVVIDYILSQYRLRRAMGTLTEKPEDL
jgi:outer membrane protein TolC